MHNVKEEFQVLDSLFNLEMTIQSVEALVRLFEFSLYIGSTISTNS
jgi:hypothetical protein